MEGLVLFGALLNGGEDPFVKAVLGSSACSVSCGFYVAHSKMQLVL